MSLAQFALDLGKTAALHPWWFGRETLQRLTEVRAKGRARFEHGLPQVYHHVLDPRLERMAVEVGGASWTDNPKAMIVARFCRLLQPATVLEIGTFRGGMTYHIARNTPDACRIWTLDLPPGALDARMAEAMVDTDVNLAAMDRSQVGEQWKGTAEAGKITQLWGDSLCADFSVLAPVGLIYIDGSHAERWVARDTENAFNCLGPTGAILWDDCYWADVLKVLGRYAKQHPIFMFEDGQTAGYVRIDGKPLVPTR